MKIRFWGVRGSIPCPGRETVQFGGNTLCIELRFGTANRLIIIDAGSGIRQLGDYLVKNDLSKGPIDTEIFLTHTHWDHIMGFPFFTPIYIPGTKLRIYGPVSYEEDTLEKIIGDLLRYRYFPVLHSELAAQIEYHQLKECKMDLGDNILLKTKYLNHPLLCLGYRFEHNGKVFCTVYDTEPFRNVFPTDPKAVDYDPLIAEEGEKAAKEENDKVSRFFSGADIVVYDTQYTKEEYFASKIGWGHGYFEYAVDAARQAKVKKLVLFHHDPARIDKELVDIEKHYKQLEKSKSDMEIVMARDGMELEL